MLFYRLCVMLLLTAAPLPQPAEPLGYNQTVQGQLGETHMEDVWQFTGQAGDLILISMQSRNADNLDTYLTLSNNQGNALMTDDDGGEGFNSRIGPYELPDDDTYQITAASYSGSGEYILQLINLKTRPYLKNGKPLVGQVDQSQPAEYFLLQAADDTESLYRITASDDESYSNPILTVYDMDGLITSTEYQTESVIDPLVASPGHVYVIVVSANTSSRGTPYELTLAPSEVDLLRDGAAQSGSLDYQHYTRQHYFHAEAGQNIRLTVTTTGGTIAPAIEVQSTDFDYVIFSSEGKGLHETTVQFEVPASTVYGITIHDTSYETSEGTYEVMVESVEAE